MMDGDLKAAFDRGWALLEEGARSRKSPMHTPSLASIDAAGLPTQRVLVLRAAEREAARLRFHTDVRSPKVSEIGDGAAVHVLAYHPDARIQLRLSGTARVERAGEMVDTVWRDSTLFARRCYLAEGAPGSALDAPGSGLPAWVEGREPDESEVQPARANFALLFVEVRAMDWLHLANSGHRRAWFERVGGEWSGRWLLP
jgi:pyridoxamine 5'-phosphate oxidase